jgi:phospholipase C
MRARFFSCPILIAGLASCGGHGALGQPPPIPPLGTGRSNLQLAGSLPTRIDHVIIIFQENRTPDYLFQGVPHADISKTAKDSRGQIVPLHSVSLAAGYDLDHQHNSFIRDYDGGKMDGFDAGLPQRLHLRPFGYAPRSEVGPYYDMATQYVFADHMFQSHQSASFPSHLYIISGTAGGDELRQYEVAGNSYYRGTGKPANAGCDATKRTVVDTIDPENGSAGPRSFPCFDRLVLSDLLDAKGVSWRYYQNHARAGIWNAFDSIEHVRYGSDYQNVVVPSTQVLKDIANQHLADVSWVIPGVPWSDHAGRNSTTKGPSWVAAIVNAVGESKYWKTTAIFVTWDDWGGWYDHVPPPIRNYYELGFRVPLVVISPYAKHRYVSKVPHEFGSILAFAEETFGIPKGSLNSTDRIADDLRDAFDFSQKPRAFKHIPAPKFKPGPNLDIADDDP